MPGADPPPGSMRDPLAIECRFASLEPVRTRRASGAVFESVVLGRLEFVRMPPDRSSFWFGHQHMPDSRYSLQIVCEVEDDDTPGVDHVASVVSRRRNQVRDAAACLPLLNARLRDIGMETLVREDDLVLTAIYLRSQPLLDPCHELEYRVALTPNLLVTVAFVYGVPLSVRVDREA
jgi:hypothetical protein